MTSDEDKFLAAVKRVQRASPLLERGLILRTLDVKRPLIIVTLYRRKADKLH